MARFCLLLLIALLLAGCHDPGYQTSYIISDKSPEEKSVQEEGNR